MKRTLAHSIKTAVVLIFVVASVAATLADVITLKDGTIMEGIIGAEDRETILLSVPGEGVFKIPKASVETIEQGPSTGLNHPNRETVDGLKFLSCGEYYKKLQKVFRNAQESILVMMYFVNYAGRPGYPATELVDLLVDAHKRGVKVEVLLETSIENNITEANRRAAAHLSKHGIDARFHPLFPIMHVKLVIVDGMISIVGSHNWTLASAKANIESSVLIRSERVAEKYSRYFQNNFSGAEVYREKKN